MTGYAPESDPSDAPLYTGAGDLEEAVHEMFSIVTEVSITHLAITIIALFVTFFGLFSGFIKERLYIGEAIIATACGIAFSGYAAGIFAPRTWSHGHESDEVTLEVTRVIIALSVFAVGVELPKAYVKRHWKSLVFLLGPVMFAGWMVSAALMYAIIPGLDFLPALVVAAGVTPTDPILASSVVGKGKFAQEHVPAHIRHILQAESGCNDGAAFPFLYLALFLLLRGHHSVGQAVGYWILLCVLYQIVLGVIIGTVVGIAARKLLKYSKRRALIDRESMVAMYVALALLVTGATTLCGSDDLLAAFCCGTAFAWDDWFTESIEESNFSSTIDLLANCTVFLYLGATMPFKDWNAAELTLTPWRLVLLSLGILVLRRLPSIYFLQWWIPDIKTRREAIFAGHFGPMGVGAIFISTLAVAKLPTPTLPPETSLDRLSLLISPITYFIVLSSILIHGLTISFFSLGRTVHSRVTSITRTFTTNTTRNGTIGNEPSWLSRVKRAHAGEEIVINRDDDFDIEKGSMGALESAETTDETDLRRIASGDSRVSGASSFSELSVEEEQRIEAQGPQAVREEAHRIREAERKKAHDLENDENPPKNVLGPSRSRASDRSRGSSPGRPGRPRRRSSADRDTMPVLPSTSPVADDGVVPPTAPIPSWARAHFVNAEVPTRPRGASISQALSAPFRALIPEVGRVAKAEKGEKGERLEKVDKAERVETEGEETGPTTGTSPAAAVPGRSSLDSDKAHEARYCTPNKTSIWREGNKLVIDRDDGEDVEVIDLGNEDTDDYEDLRSTLSKWKQSRSHFMISRKDIEDEKSRVDALPSRTRKESDLSAMQRIMNRMLAKDTLTPEERLEKERKQRERDELCKLEQRYSSADNSAYVRRARARDASASPARDSGTVAGRPEVLRQLDDDEREAAKRKYAKALINLGVDKEALVGLLGLRPSGVPSVARDVDAGTGSSPLAVAGAANSTIPEEDEEEEEEESKAHYKSSGVPLTRSERLEPESSDDDASASDASTPSAEPAKPKKSAGVLSSMTGLLKGKQTAPVISGPIPIAPDDGNNTSNVTNMNASNTSSSIRFADLNRPHRQSSTSGSRSFPVVGAGLNTRRK